MTYRRKLIEVALPLDAINRESAREKSIRHGHPSTLHLWWARRPLAACRAVLFAQLVDDPSARPEEFPTAREQDAERARLFALLEELVKWESSTKDAVLATARAEIRRCFDGDPPPVLDPFCGGGSIPLEAQRLGLEAHASDLNPVPVLITKALIELPATFADRSPVHPQAEHRTTWKGAQGLAEDVRRYGAWMREEAQRRIGHLYPQATLDDGTTAPVIAWLWARTVTCPNPACRATMPLARSFWLGKKKGKEAWVRPVPDGDRVRFEIGHGPGGPPVDGTVGRNGATCLVCSSPVPLAHVRAEGKAGRMGTQLMAVVAEGYRRRVYLPPSPEHEKAADVSRPDDVPETELAHDPRNVWCPQYGLERHADLFTNRQLTALTTFSDLVHEARERVVHDSGDVAYAEAVATYLAFSVSRLSDYSSTLSTWASNPQMEIIRGVFSRQALPITWDFAESNVFGPSSGSLTILMEAIERAVKLLPSAGPSTVRQRDAREAAEESVVVCTDPPYYDNVAYANLADFFYVWLRRSLREVYPSLLGTLLTPKQEELVADPYRAGDRAAANRHFEEGFFSTFAAIRSRHPEDVPMTVFYAFKQAETDGDDEGVASTGWETMLTGLLSAGFMVTATWPMRSERSGRMRDVGSNALASSIVLACRPRPETAPTVDRRTFVAALKADLPGALREMQQGAVAPVDLAQSAIGPGMAVFSRYTTVLEADGTAMTVRAALAQINNVLDEVLAEQEGEFDAETRWAIKWFEQHGFDEGRFGTADVLARATNTAVAALQEAGIVRSARGAVSLLTREEMPDDWDPGRDSRVPVWEVTQHLIKRLETGGERAAADLLAQVGAEGEVARDLAYRLYSICERRKWAKQAMAFNALVTSWPEIQRLAGHAPTPDQVVSDEQLF